MLTHDWLEKNIPYLKKGNLLNSQNRSVVRYENENIMLADNWNPKR